MKTITYYFIFVNDDVKLRTGFETDYHGLYAYTDDKNLLKKFQKERDMRKFTVVKREVDSSDLHELFNEMPSGFLVEQVLSTKSTDPHDIRGMCRVVITMPQYELIYINRESMGAISSGIWIHTSYCNPLIFKDKYVKALEKIGFVDGYKFMTMTKETPTSDCYTPSLDETLFPDQLNTFLHFFGDTMKV